MDREHCSSNSFGTAQEKTRKTGDARKSAGGNGSCTASSNSRARQGAPLPTRHVARVEMCQNNTVWAHCLPINTLMSGRR